MKIPHVILIFPFIADFRISESDSWTHSPDRRSGMTSALSPSGSGAVGVSERPRCPPPADAAAAPCVIVRSNSSAASSKSAMSDRIRSIFSRTIHASSSAIVSSMTFCSSSSDLSPHCSTVWRSLRHLPTNATTTDKKSTSFNVWLLRLHALPTPAWVRRSRPLFICLSVCLFVCPQHNLKTNDPKVFKLGTGMNDLGIYSKLFAFGVKWSKVKVTGSISPFYILEPRFIDIR